MAEKTAKNVQGFSYTMGKPYMKLFYHPVIEEDGMAGHRVKAFHEVCDLTINIPEENGWKLICAYKDGAFMPTDASKEVVFKNREHGQDYKKCDVCGHWCKNSYVIENVNTGEELQVGCECVKKFGIKSFDFLSKFTHDLYAMYDYRISYATDEEYGDLEIWRGKSDSAYKNAYKKSELIMAAKKEYDRCPVYKKGYYQGRIFYPSETLEKVKENLSDENVSCDINYVDKVCSHTLSKPVDGEFSENMHRLAKDYYAYIDESVYAFFMVKNYEDSLKSQPIVRKGMQVKICGKVIQQQKEESYYGMMVINTILTDSGITCERIGKIPIEETNGVLRTSFYTLIKGIYRGKIILDRATKNPKKGIETVTI